MRAILSASLVCGHSHSKLSRMDHSEASCTAPHLQSACGNIEALWLKRAAQYWVHSGDLGTRAPAGSDAAALLAAAMRFACIHWRGVRDASIAERLKQALCLCGFGQGGQNLLLFW